MAGRRAGTALLLVATAAWPLAGCGGSQPGDHAAQRTGGPVFGYSDGAYSNTDPAGAGEATKAADYAARGGARVVRVLVRWAFVQPSGPTEWTWDTSDSYVAALRARGIRPLFVVTSAPDWALDPADHCGGPVHLNLCPPARAHLAEWAAFIQRLLRRYAGARPYGLEVWNEPNFVVDWKSVRGIDPKRYAQMLHVAARAVRDVAPDVPVVLGGLALVGDDPANLAVSPARYLRRLKGLGIAGDFDALGVHPYPRPDAQHPAPATGRVEDTLAKVRRAAAQAFGRDIPLWITETGYATPPSGGGEVDEAGQASGLLSLYDRAAKDPDVKLFLVYRLRDPVNVPPADAYGVLRGDWSPKPAYCRLAEAFGSPGACGG
jgi:hypothetical protein